MLGKSIIAGTVLTLMAGGVVYFGTEVSSEQPTTTKTVKKTTITETVEETTSDALEDAKDLKTAAGKTISAKKLTIKTAEAPKDVETENGTEVDESKTSKSQKKWLDQYLKSEKPKTESNPRKIQTSEVDSREPSAKEQMTDMKLAPKSSYGSGSGASKNDTGSFVVKDNDSEIKALSDEDIKEAEEKGFKKRLFETENIWVEKNDSKKSQRKMLHDIIKKKTSTTKDTLDHETEKKVEVEVIADENGKTRIETETIDMGDGKTMKIIKKMVTSDKNHDKDDKKIRIKIMADAENHDDVKIDDIHSDKVTWENIGKVKTKKDISKTVALIMAETEKIEMPELRDRAYLNLITYALDNCSYKVANKALGKIKQVELRDTARNLIAVAHAKEGNTEKAFSILNDIEVDDMRDVIRLQVIEAMTVPDTLSKDMQ